MIELVAVIGFCAFVMFSTQAHANLVVEKPSTRPKTLLGEAPPYTPRQTEYFLEMGLINTTSSTEVTSELLWIGTRIGRHLGECVFVRTDTCQMFVDGIAGFGVRESETHLQALISLRWQYVNFPDRHSFFWRVMGGSAQVHRPEGRGWHGLLGAGVGVTTYLHENFDLSLEIRGGDADRPFVIGNFGVQIKTDRLLSQFAKRLRSLGYGTVETAIEATSETLKATGEGLGEIVDGVSKPFRESESKSKGTDSK